MEASYKAYNDFATLQAAIALRETALKEKAQPKELIDELAKVQKAAADVTEGSQEAPGIGPTNRDLSRYFVMVESADIRPAASAQKAFAESCSGLQKLLATWQKLNDENIPALNKQLESVHIGGLPVETATKPLVCSSR